MSRTILGLVGVDNKVYFGDPPCDTRIACIDEDVEGCVEWTGDHANQVKVTITQADNDDCNDTYYGCVNWATRKFQITIPDDCCTFTPGVNCEHCTAGETPAQVRVTFSDVLNCSDCYTNITYSQNYAESINGSHILTQVQGSPCVWDKCITGTWYVRAWDGPSCTGNYNETTFSSMRFWVWKKDADTIEIRVIVCTENDCTGNWQGVFLDAACAVASQCVRTSNGSNTANCTTAPSHEGTASVVEL